MTLDEFQAALQGAGHRWNIDRLNMLRDEAGRCPICSLAKDRGWRPPYKLDDAVGNAWWDKAAEYLGLTSGDARLIANAADTINSDWPTVDTRAFRAWLWRLVGTP